MSQRALVTGATGLLGREVLKAFEGTGYETTGTGFTRASPPKILKVDIQDAEQVQKLFDEVKPHVVVHCAADRKPDSCTQNPSAARLLNVTATTHLAKAARSHGSFLIYISTDYVFPGTHGDAPYKNDAVPKPTNIYGETKLHGEQTILDTIPDSSGVVLRVPVLYGYTEPADNNAESAINVLMDVLWKTPDEKIKMDDWAIRYPTNTSDVGRVCCDIAKYYTRALAEERTGLPRILQFSSEDRMTKYEICQQFSELMGLPMDHVVPDKDGGKPGPDGTVRPFDCHLDTGELKRLGIDVSTVDFVAWWRWKVRAYRH